jgi:hypothetical protein
MMTGDDLVGLLGAVSNDSAVVRALQAFAIRWPPELEASEDPEDSDWRVWRPSSANGFEFGFQDEAHLRARTPNLRGASPLVLTSVCFYGVHEGVRPYAHAFPFGIVASDSREMVRAKLSHLAVGPRVHIRDVWDAPTYRIVAEHNARTGALDNLLVKLRLEPWPPLEEEPPPEMPAIDEIVAVFGQPWDSPDMRRVFSPLGFDAGIAARGQADLRTHGLALRFFREEKNPKSVTFCAAKFFRARHEDARAWAGPLPCGLAFDIAYPELVRRMGRAPDQGRDGALTGYAVWDLPTFTLHALYHNVDNVILCVSIFQPGAWRGGD